MKFNKLSLHIDVDNAIKRLVDDEELFMNILGMLVNEFDLEKVRLESTIAARSRESVAELAHYFKGIAGNLDVFNVCRGLEKIECACSSDDWTTIELEFKNISAEMQALAIAYDSTLKGFP